LLLTLSFLRPSPPVMYTLSLHGALPIFRSLVRVDAANPRSCASLPGSTHRIPAKFSSARNQLRAPARNADWSFKTQACFHGLLLDRKSTRLNSSHVAISYAVFCLKKKNK